MGATLRDRLADTQPEPLCRKGNMNNCGVSVSEFSSIVFRVNEDLADFEPHIPAHVECSAALMNIVPSNEAAAAPVEVANAPYNLQFDLGCMAQMTAAGEVAGQMMLDKLLELEAEKAAAIQS